MVKGTILVDEKMQTNLPDVYAVGDCAFVVNSLTGGRQWSAMGSTANLCARAMAKGIYGMGKGYGGCLGTGVVRLLPTLNAGRTGLTQEQAAAQALRRYRRSVSWMIRRTIIRAPLLLS